MILVRDDTTTYASTAWHTQATGTEADPFVINTAADLAGLAQLVNGGNTFHERFIRLGNNITLSGQWVPIGNSTALPFRGHFHGFGHTISGLSMSGNTVMNGLFGQLGDGATIRNLTLSNPSITSTSTVGGQHFASLAARVGGGTIVIRDIIINGGTIQTPNNASNNHRIGGVIGEIIAGSNVEMRNISVAAGTTILSRHTTANNINHTVGGLVGLNNGTLEIRNSGFSGIVQTTGNGVNGALGTFNVGGFIGSANSATQIHNSLFNGTITSAGTGGQGGMGSTGSGFLWGPPIRGGTGGQGNPGGNGGMRHVGGFIGLGNAVIEIHNSIAAGQVSITGGGGRGGTGGTGASGMGYVPHQNDIPFRGGDGGQGGNGGAGGTHHMGCSVGRLAGGSLLVVTTANGANRTADPNAIRGQGGLGGSGGPAGGGPGVGNTGLPGALGALPVMHNNPILGSGAPLTTIPGEPQGPIGPMLDAPVLSITGPHISWNNIFGNNGYYVQVDQGGTWTTRYTTGVNVTTFNLGPLGLGGGTHNIRVITRGITGVIANSPPSNVVEFIGVPLMVHFNFTGGSLLMPPQPQDQPLPTVHYMNNVWEHRNHEDFAGMTFHGWFDRPPHQSGALPVTNASGITQVWALWLPTL